MANQWSGTHVDWWLTFKSRYQKSLFFKTQGWLEWWFVNKQLQYSRWFDHVCGPCPHSNCIVFLQPYCKPMIWNTCWLMAYLQESLSKIIVFQNLWVVSGWIIIFFTKWSFVNKQLQYSRWFDHVCDPCPHSNCIVFLQPYGKSMIWNTCWLMAYLQESLSKIFVFQNARVVGMMVCK